MKSASVETSKVGSSLLEIGKINRCQVVRFSEIGAFLEGDENWEDFLLPTKYVPEDTEVGDTLDVMIYFDSEGRIISSTKTPLAQVGEFTSLKVTTVEEVGTFLNWGVDKDLFVPHREQLYEMEVGESYPVFVYLDKSGRPAATTRINKHVDKARPPYKGGDEVELLIYQETELGFRALINKQYTGVIYRDDVLNNLKLGQTTTGYIKHVRYDHKIDLSIRPLVAFNKSDLMEFILTKLRENGGSLPINATTPSEIINETFGVSRKKFKVALGALYKQRLVEIEDTGMRLKV